MNRLFQLFANWVISRAMRTPYFHLSHPDGRPYMDRYWLARWGHGGTDSGGNPMPKYALRVHHIRSSDLEIFHDHPWDFVSLLLRGGYHEERPYVSLSQDVAASASIRTQADSGELYVRDTYTAGQLLYRRATDWHRLRLPELYQAEGTWTLVLLLPKRQSWGFRVNGRKVHWREYLSARKFASATRILATPTGDNWR